MIDKLIDRISFVVLALIIGALVTLIVVHGSRAIEDYKQQHEVVELTYYGIGIKKITAPICLDDTMFVYRRGRHHGIPEYLKPSIEHAISVYYDSVAGIDRAADPGLIPKPR